MTQTYKEISLQFADAVSDPDAVNHINRRLFRLTDLSVHDLIKREHLELLRSKLSDSTSTMTNFINYAIGTIAKLYASTNEDGTQSIGNSDPLDWDDIINIVESGWVEVEPIIEPKPTRAVLHSFAGTYCTRWEPNYPTDSRGNTIDDGSVNFSAYLEELGKQYTEGITNLLPDVFTYDNFVFEDTRSPREYNFSTDRIFVELKDYFNQINYLRGYASYYRSKFDYYLRERYTSRSGFMSHYSNDVLDWEPKCNTELDHNEIGDYIYFYLINELEGQRIGYTVDDCVAEEMDDRLDNWVYSNYEYENLELLNAIDSAIDADVALIPVWLRSGDMHTIRLDEDYTESIDVYAQIMCDRQYDEAMILGQLIQTR